MKKAGCFIIFILYELFFLFFSHFDLHAQLSYEQVIRPTDQDLLADASEFPFWEKKTNYTKIYHVASDHPQASDDNPGTAGLPFKSISKAASVLMPGEMVIIHQGTYRETIRPAHGGSGPEKMILYQAAEGEEVIVSGSVVLDDGTWEPGGGWRYGPHTPYSEKYGGEKVPVYQVDLPGDAFGGYNPFGMVNMLHDRSYLQYQKVNMKPHFKRRGMVFLDGHPIEQVLSPVELAEKSEGAFWVEHNGLRLHVRFPDTTGPEDFAVEVTAKEQLFVPEEYGLGYIKIKGIRFRQCGNGFPVPQRGMVSSNRGHHWIIEDCVIEWANALGMDLGNEMWHTHWQPGVGHHIARRNIIRHCGIAGLEALRAPGLLIEDNLFEDIGWQDAEHAWESGGIKLHLAKNCLIRRNLFRKIHHAPGIWLDYRANQNCRICYNVFTDITTARGAIYIEVSRNHCRVDHNIFHKLRSQYWISGDYGAGGSAFYTDGSDSIDFEYNLVLDIENTGYGSYLNAERIIGTRGGLTRYHRVSRNIFIDCRKHAIEFPNPYNYSDYNLFSQVRPGYLKMTNPAPPLLLDLEAWQKAFGWEDHGAVIDIEAGLDSESLLFDLRVKTDPLPDILAGPFTELKTMQQVHLDPRQLSP